MGMEYKKKEYLCRVWYGDLAAHTIVVVFRFAL